jgi:hypothetical protein
MADTGASRLMSMPTANAISGAQSDPQLETRVTHVTHHLKHAPVGSKVTRRRRLEQLRRVENLRAFAVDATIWRRTRTCERARSKVIVTMPCTKCDGALTDVAGQRSGETRLQGRRVRSAPAIRKHVNWTRSTIAAASRTS